MNYNNDLSVFSKLVRNISLGKP